MTTGTILRDLGLLWHVPGLMALLTLPVCVLAGETHGVPAFVVTAVLSFGCGQALYLPFRRAQEMQLRHAMVAATLAWITIPAFGMLPFLWLAYAGPEASLTATLLDFRQPWNAFFEAVSGFTGTGLTVSADPGELPRSLQWWRSFMQWVGGVGIIVLVMAIVTDTAEAGRLLYSEARDRKILPDVRTTLRAIWWIYSLYTVLGVVALRLAGMGWWDAVNYGMTGISTGGFGVTDGSLADYGAAPRVIVIVLMILGAISFAAHYRIIGKLDLRYLWRDVESRALAVLLCGGGLILALENLLSGADAAWLDTAFQWVSALCTAGFRSADFTEWSVSAQLFMTAAMALGGAAGATTGGIKLRRVVWLAGAAWHRVRRISLHPWVLMEHKPILASDRPAYHGPHIEAALVVTGLWLVAASIGTVALLHLVPAAVPSHEVLFEAMSALGNAGLSSGVTSAELAWPGKLTLIVLMWLGRLEIVPVLVFLSWAYPLLRGRRDSA